ncbi:reverse transcriptase domain-containing protein [Tanacetum coccineum]
MNSRPCSICYDSDLKDIVRALLLRQKNQASASLPAPHLSKQNASTSGSGNSSLVTQLLTLEKTKGYHYRSRWLHTSRDPPIPTSSVVKPIPEVTKDQVHPYVFSLRTAPSNLGSTKPSVSLPYPSRRDNEKSRMEECLALADLGASINLMPFSVWEKLSLPDLTPTCMTLELADRSISKPMGIAKDISVKVGVFHFPADFVVVDFDPDPRVPLILGRCFLKTSRALIDVRQGYSPNTLTHDANKIDVIDMACEEYSQEVLGFTDIIASGNSTPSHSFPWSLADDPNCPAYNPFYYDPEGDILILEGILNSEPPPPLPNHKQYMPGGRKELELCEAKTIEPSVHEPPEVELKELPPHLEYAFLEGDNKLPVIIAKELDVEEKSALVKVLKSHKRALAWKLSDIQGINPEFCTHKILMEEDYAPAVQHQRRVNPKIHDVIKKEVEKLLESGLIYPISDSPWVSPVHCVPKKGGITVVMNEEN